MTSAATRPPPARRLSRPWRARTTRPCSSATRPTSARSWAGSTSRWGILACREQPTDERLKAVRDGTADPNLEALCFQFGRYLLASSSRAGGQPANLQGIWNESVSPPWGSKYTININTEMNYWPAEVCNLSECHQPLFDMLKDISVTGAKTAKTYYGCGGWVAHHNIDLWRGTAPVDAACYGMWPMGGAWLCRHLWEHYAFTGDRKFLEEYYPVMKGAAQFLLEVMVEHPKHHWLVTPFSISPEHGYLDDNGKPASLSPSPTMDRRHHPGPVPALHRGGGNPGRGRGIPRPTGRRAEAASALSGQPPRPPPGVDRGLAARRPGAQHVARFHLFPRHLHHPARHPGTGRP